MRKIFFIATILLLGTALSVGGGYAIDAEATNTFIKRKVLGIRCIDYKQAVYSKKLRDLVPHYIDHARKNGISKCANEAELIEKKKAGKLVLVRDRRGYSIDKLTHSYPYLTPAAAELLKEIGRRYRRKVSDSRMRGSDMLVTSITRTTDKLKELRGVNGNASENSPHLYGNTFDISYRSFSSRRIFVTPCDEKYMMEALAEVIYELKMEKKCWATYERQQTCYHVVAR